MAQPNNQVEGFAAANRAANPMDLRDAARPSAPHLGRYEAR